MLVLSAYRDINANFLSIAVNSDDLFFLNKLKLLVRSSHSIQYEDLLPFCLRSHGSQMKAEC